MLIAVVVTLNLQQTTNLAPFFAVDALRGYLAFPVGVLVASFVSSYRINKPLVTFLLLAIAVCTVFTVLTPGFIDSTSAFIFIIAPALIILAQTETAQKLFRHSFWSHLSAISFNTYVWQSTLQVLLGLIAPRHRLLPDRRRHVSVHAARMDRGCPVPLPDRTSISQISAPVLELRLCPQIIPFSSGRAREGIFFFK